MSERREVVITGVGLLSCLGEGLEVTFDRLVSGPPSHDAEAFAPFVVHRLGPVSFDLQIPRKGDQRQMEPWQRIGVYTAGLALASAGLKGDTALLDRTDMIVAAGGGERDVAVDAKILTGIRGQPNPQAFMNERLMNDLRPTLFLAQLPNLVAGNISIVHGIVGSSRTFIGEEAAGTDAVRVAHARIAARQSDITLVGGGYHAERLDLVLNYEMARALLRPPFRSVWDRGPEGGIAMGSLGAFLVLEAREHAEARGAAALARLTSVTSGRTPRAPGDVAAALDGMWDRDCRRDPAGGGRRAVGCVRRRAGLHRREGRSWRPADCPYARPAPISGKASRRSFPPIWRSRRKSCGAGSCSRPRERAIPGRRASRYRRSRSPASDTGVARGWLSSSGCEGRGRRMATRDKAGRPIVVVTGMGIVTSLGTGKDENWTKLTAGESGIRRITRFDTTGLRTTIAGTVDHVYTPGMEPSVLSETIAWLAGEEAIAESRLGGPGTFPGPLFLAMPPLEIEWSHRLALSKDAPAGQPIDYGTLIQAASSGRFTDCYERAKFGIVGEHLADASARRGRRSR